MKLRSQIITEVYQYENESERDNHTEEMKNKGWKIANDSPLLKSGLIRAYSKTVKERQNNG